MRISVSCLAPASQPAHHEGLLAQTGAIEEGGKVEIVITPGRDWLILNIDVMCAKTDLIPQMPILFLFIKEIFGYLR